MGNTPQATLVFKDQAGEYYLLPQATLEQGRVPEEHKAEVEQLIAAGGPDGDDLQGHILPAIYAFAFVAGFVGGFTAVEALEEGSSGTSVISFVQGHQAAIKGINRGVK